MMETPWSKSGYVGFLDKLWKNPIRQNRAEYRIKMLGLINEEAGLFSDAIIVDCGCGTGILFEYLPGELKQRYIGLDFTPEMVQHCKKAFRGHEDRFHQADLLNVHELASLVEEIKTGTIFVTQNVIQHITLYQMAVNNIFAQTPTSILMCERTHYENTRIQGYNPTRWRFKEDDYYHMLEYFAGDRYTTEKLGRPRTTKNERNMLTIFRVRSKKTRIETSTNRTEESFSN